MDGRGMGRLSPCRSESVHFHSGTTSGRIRDGDGDRDLILGKDSSLDNRVEEVEEDFINGGLDEGVIREHWGRGGIYPVGTW